MTMQLTKLQKLFIGVSVQALILLVIILLKLATLHGGVEVLLKIQPSDPRDIFKGDYMTFMYDVSSLTVDNPVRAGELLYIPLTRQGQFWGADMAQSSRPAEGLFLTGRARYNSVPVKGTSGFSNVSVIYGIEQYYIAEGTGQEVRVNGNSYAKVAIDAEGKSIVKQIFIDGKPFPAK